MIRSQCLTLLYLFSFLVAASCKLQTAVCADEVTRALPNIVILYADDLGYGDVQCYNPQRGKILTPNIDRLAAQGMRFTDGHSSSAVCSPSRYTLLTGRYHWRTRLQSGIVGVFGEPLIARDRLTIAGLAKQHGYRTAAIGKWHLGMGWPLDDKQRQLLSAKAPDEPDDEATITQDHREAWQAIFSQAIAEGPTTRGFDSYFGTDVPNWPPYCFIEDNFTLGIPSRFLPEVNFVKNQASLRGPAIEDWSLSDILPKLAERASQFVTSAALTNEPFLLYMPLTSPHTPLAVNAPWRGKSNLNLYADFVMETDAVVGQVLEALERSGAADTTLVIFTSDNGCAHYIGTSELETQGHFPSGPLRGYKSDAWEGGHRVPFIVRWPGVVKPNSVCRQLVHQADLMATMAELFARQLANDVGEDSHSFLPLLNGENVTVRETSVSCSIKGIPSLRVGRWKYIPAAGSGGWSESEDESQPEQLYDLEVDLGETNNLASLQPEQLAQMKVVLEKIIDDGRSTPGAPQQNDVSVKRYPLEASQAP